MSCTDHSASFPLSNFRSQLDFHRARIDRSSIGNLPPSLPSAGMTLSPLLLASQVLRQSAALIFFRIEVAIDRFMANLKSSSELPGTPFLFDQFKCTIEHGLIKSFGILAIQITLVSFLAGLVRAISSLTRITHNLARNGGFTVSGRATQVDPSQ